MPNKRPEPRKTPRQSRSRALYDAVLVATAELLERSGPAFTLEAVAERAGVSPGSLYQYFPNRAALIGALIDRQVEQDRALLDRFEATGFVDGDPAELLVDGVLHLYGQRPALMAHMATLLREVGRQSDVLAIIDEFSTALAAVLDQASEGRTVDACQDAARTAIHAVLGIVRSSAEHEPERLHDSDMKARLIAVARAAMMV